MKTVFVRPERCVGCRQCALACAAAHSRSGTLLGALDEQAPSFPRIHIGAGLRREAFPNRCRHCDPAPCQAACLPGAIQRDLRTDTVFVDPKRCIRCGSCAMACPFGVIRFHADPLQAPSRLIAQKCDNCMERQKRGLVPACVEACKAGALLFEEVNRALQEKTRTVARIPAAGIVDFTAEEPGPMELLRSLQAGMVEL